MKKIFFSILVFFAFVNAENLIQNGDMKSGNAGGWYLWNNPDGPADMEYTITDHARIIVKKAPNPYWGLQLQAPKWQADSALYKLSFRAKGNGVLNAVVQGNGPDWAQKETSSWELGKDWKTYSMPFLANEKGYGMNNVIFQLGFIKDTVWIDDVIVEPFAGKLDTAWYNQANTRIEQYRKFDFKLKATGSDSVKVELVRHEFPFGTALALQTGKDSVEQWYRKTAAKYFWAGVNENIFKWPDYEPSKGTVNRKVMQEYLDFAKENGWDFRAHTLVWGHQGYGFDKHWSIQGSCKDLEKNIKARIERDLKEYKGKISEYDVWNEPFHEPFLFNKCGWQILDSAFIWARKADPTAKLYLNEYNVVAAGETERFYNIVEGMLARKVPIDGLGVQCHFRKAPVIPALIKERLDKLASLGLDIKVTELDFDEPKAELYKTFVTTAYSHPAVKGIFLWGFWDKRHWISNGGIIDANGKPRPAADTLYNLWHKTWTTNFKSVPKNGEVSFRGFPGKYKITAGNKETFVVCSMGKAECSSDSFIKENMKPKKN